MLKGEYALQQVRERLIGAGPVTLDTLIAEAWRYTDDGDPRWVGVALMRLNQAGEIRYLSCDDNHNHDSTCAVEFIPI